ncbi:hypothetical protein FALBO_9056 [Fusarium albosuccineum]|uniref:Uncharacterized protein n=1 Tax=Fusarium albosuccineum TaxID=1237068 RepID=A0A8H4P9C6_9HYPO|nr:hypothetical protein FALBO_9056 [Fusarium albosuccineum]
MSNQLPFAILRVPIDIPRITSTKQASTFNYYGLVDDSLTMEASKFLAQLTDGAEVEMEPTIKTFLRTTQSDCNGYAEEKRACWLTIRLTKRSTAFEVPRWHQDGSMYSYDEGREEVVRSKYALTLLGPPTLILHPDEHVYTTHREGLAQHWRWVDAHKPSEEEIDDADHKLRQRFATEFKYAPSVQVGHGDVIRFSWGRDDSPVHSEPDLVSDRVFMTVLYGSESELERMCEWRDEQYGKHSIR